MLKALLSLLLACALASGADFPSQRRSRKIWLASVAAVVAVSVLDARSSWGKPELNPLLRGSDGTFGARGLGIKSAMVSSSLIGQWWVLHHQPKAVRSATIVNAGMTAFLGATAAHNLGQK